MVMWWILQYTVQAKSKIDTGYKIGEIKKQLEIGVPRAPLAYLIVQKTDKGKERKGLQGRIV